MPVPTGPGRQRGRARVMNVGSDRFAFGLRLIDPTAIVPTLVKNERPDIEVDVIRPLDLAAFTLEGYDLELRSGARPVIRTRRGRDGYLVVRFAYQHLGEHAIYEEPAPVPDPDDPAGKPPLFPDPTDPLPHLITAPVDARPARGSRVVFEVPHGTEIPFCTAGILGALGELEMAVHPLATPKPGRLVLPGGRRFLLGNDLVATAGAAGLIVTTARGAGHDVTTAAGLAARHRDTRAVRRLLATRSGIVERSPVPNDGINPTVRIGTRTHEIGPILGRQGLTIPHRTVRNPRLRERRSRPPHVLETSIEAPYRLIISPSARGGWAHSDEPVAAEGAEHRVELWHTRLGVRRVDDDVRIDERKGDRQRIIRAVWARDRDAFPDWRTEARPLTDATPFRMSLDSPDREMLVRQSSETPVFGGTAIPPSPVDATELMLSSLGAWLDLHGEWNTDPYSLASARSILSWDHVAPEGRDQFVRVVYPGYLFPCGHQTTLVKITERKMKKVSPSVAGLYQRMFLVVGEPLRTYDDDHQQFPLSEIRIAPLVTPTINEPTETERGRFFFPLVGGQPFRWTLHAKDLEERPVRFSTPLLWVSAGFADSPADRQAVRTAYEAHDDVAADGQMIAFAEVTRGGDTASPTEMLKLGGDPDEIRSEPKMTSARIRLKAAQQLGTDEPVTISYAANYLANGFDQATNPGEVWAELAQGITLEFGAGNPSDQAGGFVQPNLPIEALSRLKGAVGDAATVAAGDFDPTAFLSGVTPPKLFGLVDLLELLGIDVKDLAEGPNVVSEALDRIESFAGDLERLKSKVDDAVADAQRLVDRAQRATNKADEVRQQAAQVLADIVALEGTVDTAVDAVLNAFETLADADETTITNALTAPLATLRNALDEIEQHAPKLPPLLRNQLEQLAEILRTVLDAADLIDEITRFLNGLVSGEAEFAFRYEWAPNLERFWPSQSAAIIEFKRLSTDTTTPQNKVTGNFVLAVDGRANAKGKVAVDVLAELRDFVLHLLPGEPLVHIKFDHLSFKSGTSGKAEVDVALEEIEFVGVLGFVETLRELIPFDGFADPPHLDVSPSGLTAGFDLDLPNVAIGVFALSNLSLGAELRVPFIGESVTVAFNFCSRERPFTLAVTFIGGGGWFLMQISPEGLDVLEVGLEAGATLSVDFGVASGSISAMLGIYLRLEGDAGSLTGYFRLRGEVDVLGLISASIELYLSLEYDFPTGKMVGRARITVKVEVLFFSASVSIEAERRFAGSNGDPSFREVMAVQTDGTSTAWTDHCLAFAGA